MAELIAAVAALVTAGTTLTEVLNRLGKFLHDVNPEMDMNNAIKRLEKELRSMVAFLKYAEKNNNHHDINEIFQNRVTEVNQLVNECESVAYELRVLETEKPKAYAGCLMSSCCFSQCTNHYRRTSELLERIKKLLLDINDTSERQLRFAPTVEAGTSSGNNTVNELRTLKEQRRSAPYANNEHMVGLLETIDKLKLELTNRSSGHFVLSIVGMGGLGKTTLARKLYNTLSQQYFRIRAWVCVSQEYNTQDILMELINSICKPSDQDRKTFTTIGLMEAYMRKYLSRHRFLVVVDDVWKREAWESLERAFPNINNGSKVILTTRNYKAAALPGAYVHELRELTKDESWELFCKKAVPHDSFPLNLAGVGQEMVAKCSGLPLAIVILGGVLAAKPQNLSNWKNVRDNLWNELAMDSVHINAILTLSFKDLPYYLKPCFLYVAMFPEDFEIPISNLMMLWEAEGFITEADGCTEDAARIYFNELVGRCLFSKTGGIWTKLQTFRVHDLLRDLALREAGKTCFYDEKKALDLCKEQSHKQLAIYHPHSGIPVGYTNSSLHTLLIVKPNYGHSGCGSLVPPCHESFLTCTEKFQMLRVLDLSTFRISIHFLDSSKFFRNICRRLLLLRYVGLQTTGVMNTYEVPDTIRNLKDLQTLSIRSSMEIHLPESVFELKRLKHLIGKYIIKGYNIRGLVCLETLDNISGDNWCHLDTIQMVNLRHLSLYIKNKQVAERFYENFSNLPKLQSLNIECTEAIDHNYLCVEKIFKCCPSISHFKGCRIKFYSAQVHEFAVNLEFLELTNIVMQNMEAIEKLPQLEDLNLKTFHFGDTIDELVWSENGFPNLRNLRIEMEPHDVITVKEGCMPLLKHLEVNYPSNFKAPDRLQQLLIGKSTGY